MKQLLFALLLLSIATKAQTINTIAGSGPTGFMTGAFSGDGGPGT